MKKLLRKWLGIDEDARSLARTIQCLTEHVSNAETLIRERTDCAVDLHTNDRSYAILIGRYKGRDYVQAFPIGNGDMNSLMPELKRISEHARICWMDGHPEYRAIFAHELEDLK